MSVIPAAQTPASPGGGGTLSDAQSTQNFLNQYLYDNMNFMPGTSVINPGGGSSGESFTPTGGSSGSASPARSGSVSFGPLKSATTGATLVPADPGYTNSGGYDYAANYSWSPTYNGGAGTDQPWYAGFIDSIDNVKRGGRVTLDKVRERGMEALNKYASGGKVWDKKRPASLGKPEKLSKKEKASAKAAAKAAGRPYPNLIDNMRAARKADGGEVKAALKIARKRLTKES